MGRHREQDRPLPDRCPPLTLSVPGEVALDELLSAVAHGDLDALRALYDGTSPLVFGLLHDALSCATRAERATERIYLGLWRSAPRFDPDHTCALATLLTAVRRELARDLSSGDLPSR